MGDLPPRRWLTSPDNLSAGAVVTYHGSMVSVLRCRAHEKGRRLRQRDETQPPAGAREILRYFLRNREAADSLYGIARWRLLEEAVRHSVETTEAALHWLVATGFLLEQPSGASDPIFRLNVERVAEAAHFLNSLPASNPGGKGRHNTKK